ncbi:MAG: AAA family ATPase [Acidimicrobiales bacterium]
MRRVTARGFEVFEQAVVQASAPNPLARAGPMIAVVSGSGGCGKTFLAANLAHHLHDPSTRRTCIIDLDLQFGEVASVLRLQPRHTLADLVAACEAGDDPADILEAYTEVTSTGIHVLAGPTRLEAGDGIKATDIAAVLDAALKRFDYVIVDTPARLTEGAHVALERADQIFALATLDNPSIRNLHILLSVLDRFEVPSDRIRLVLNKVEPGVGIEVAQVRRHFPQGFSIVIPYGREVTRSVNHGAPVLAVEPGARVSKTLAGALARELPVCGVARTWRWGRRL